jgi:hypothetical protein
MGARVRSGRVLQKPSRTVDVCPADGDGTEGDEQMEVLRKYAESYVVDEVGGRGKFHQLGENWPRFTKKKLWWNHEELFENQGK